MDSILQSKIVRPIYIRKGPGRSYDFLATIYPSGKDLIFDGIEVGETWKGINEWYYKINDKNEKQYYWKGGTRNVDNELNWGIKVLGIDQIWEKTKGDGIKIAILDTGIDLSNDDLKSAIIGGHNVINNQSYAENPGCIQDTSGHGTSCASVIVAKGKVKGIAPETQLIIIKMVENESVIDASEVLFKAINKAAELGADIISISSTLNPGHQEITTLIRGLWDKHLFVSAAGNFGEGVGYPAEIPGMISVGAITIDNTESGYKEGNFAISLASTPGKKDSMHEGITLVAPGDLMPVYVLNQEKILRRGTSFATPYVAAVLALFLASRRENGGMGQQMARLMLMKTACQIPQKHNEAEWGSGVIDPVKLILNQS